MAIQDDFSVAANGDIRHTSGTTTYTVLELHRWLQDLADDAAASNNDYVEISTETPSDRSTDNIITLNDHSASGGPTFNITGTEAQFLYAGSITQGTGGTLERYSGLSIIGSFTAAPQVIQNNAPLTEYWGTSYNPDATLGIAVQILVQTISAGSTIDGGRVRVQTRNYGDQYREASTVLGLGSSPAAPGNIQADTFNATAEGTIAALTLDFATHANGGYNLIDLLNGDGAQPYASEWDLTTPGVSMSEFYEWIKWATQDGSTEQIYGMNGELFRGITHEINVDTGIGGTWVEPEPVSWAGGTGQLLAVDNTSDTSTTKMWIQLLTGTAPGDGDSITGATGGNDVNLTVTSRAIGVESAIGNYVGSLLGAYGVGIAPADLVSTDSVIDLGANPRTPPNNVTFTVEGCVVGEDYVLVGPESGGGLQKDQLSLNGALSGGEGTITVNETIPADTPATGSIRVYDGNSFVKVTYTGYTTNDFTGCSGTPAASDLADTYISYIDKLSALVDEPFTTIFDSTRSLYVRVRDGGGSPIKTFQTTGSLGPGGGSVTVIRTPDV